MINLIRQFGVLSKNEKSRIKSLSETLSLWELRIHSEARAVNGVLQLRRKDPFDLMYAGSVSAFLGYDLGGGGQNGKIFRQYNITVIGGDDLFGRCCGLDLNGNRKDLHKYWLGPWPGCFLLHDLATGLLSQNPEGDVLPSLARIAEVAVEVKVTSQFLEVFPESKDASCI